MTWLQAGNGPLLLPDPGVLRQWRADRRPFHAVVILFDSAGGRDRGPETGLLRQRMERVAAALGGLVQPVTTPHVTIHVTGLLRPVVDPEPVTVSVGGADSFASAAFLHASGKRLQQLRGEIESGCGPEVDGQRPWVPHVTVGTYRRPATAAQVAERLAPLGGLPPLRLLGRLAVVTVDRWTGELREVAGQA